MNTIIVKTLLSLLLVMTSFATTKPMSAESFEAYAAGQEGLDSWKVKYASSQTFQNTSSGGGEVRHNECEMSFDGERVFWRWYKWGGVEGTTKFRPREKAHYGRLMGD